MSVYVGQTALRLTFFIKDKSGNAVNVSSATCKLKYKKPNNQSGSWDLQKGAATNEVYWEPANSGSLSVEGKWVLWASVVFSNGKTLPSDPVYLDIKKEGI